MNIHSISTLFLSFVINLACARYNLFSLCLSNFVICKLTVNKLYLNIFQFQNHQIIKHASIRFHCNSPSRRTSFCKLFYHYQSISPTVFQYLVNTAWDSWSNGYFLYYLSCRLINFFFRTAFFQHQLDHGWKSCFHWPSLSQSGRT